VHELELAFGRAVVSFPQATESLCTAALLLEIDAVGNARSSGGTRWSDYVSDRPYVATSTLSTALTRAFGTAMSGRCKDRPELVETPIPLEITLPAVRVRGGESLVARLFEPLGYAVETSSIPLDPAFPQWGTGRLVSVRLTTTQCLRTVLEHLYVLIPVLDDDKHYWFQADEVDKLLRRGGEWLRTHPERETIATRYLLRQRSLARDAISRLAALDDLPDTDADPVPPTERARTLHDVRLDAVEAALDACGAGRVLDLGCGEGKLIRRLLPKRNIGEVVGVDVSLESLERIKQGPRWERLPEGQKMKLRLAHGSLTYRDRTLEGYDAATLVEVIEHLDPPRLSALERNVFGQAKPRTVIVTTPNREYNALYPTLGESELRHRDHRFEWTRAEFAGWAERVGQEFGYVAQLSPVGPEDPDLGAPSQMAVFAR
jgi:3' terminal RNA ribose 2'-O-methyltransferase Hen1